MKCSKKKPCQHKWHIWWDDAVCLKCGLEGVIRNHVVVIKYA